MSIQNNMMALNAQRQNQLNNVKLATSLQRLSSGYRINSAADDAAGLAISERMRAQYAGLERAMMNAQDGTSLVQTAEGALGEVHSMLNRLSELSVQASNGIYDDSQRASINNEAQEILKEIDRISQATNFNGVELLNGDLSTSPKNVAVQGVDVAQTTLADGSVDAAINAGDLQVFDGTNAADATFTINGQSFALVNAADFDATSAQLGEGVTAIQVQGTSGAGLTADDLQAVATAVNQQTGLRFEAGADAVHMNLGKGGDGLTLQVGETAEGFNQVTVDVADMSSRGLNLEGINLSTQQGAATALDRIRSAIEQVSATRGDLGATQNRLESTIRNLSITSENIQASESRVRDLDMAKELMNFTKRNILQQASMAMMAQGNLQSHQVLQLLR